jgi:hypothetical protein
MQSQFLSFALQTRHVDELLSKAWLIYRSSVLADQLTEPISQSPSFKTLFLFQPINHKGKRSLPLETAALDLTISSNSMFVVASLATQITQTHLIEGRGSVVDPRSEEFSFLPTETDTNCAPFLTH